MFNSSGLRGRERERGIIAHECIVSFIQHRSFETLCSLNVINSSQFDTGISCKDFKLPSVVQVIQNCIGHKVTRGQAFVLDA